MSLTGERDYIYKPLAFAALSQWKGLSCFLAACPERTLKGLAQHLYIYANKVFTLLIFIILRRSML